MKALFVFVFIVLGLSGHSQSVKLDKQLKKMLADPIFTKTPEKGVMYERIIQADSLTKDEIFIRAQEFVAKSYVSANDVIQMIDKEAGIIIGKGLFDNTGGELWPAQLEYDTYHIIRVEVKEGRAKCSIVLTHYRETQKYMGSYHHSDDYITDLYPFTKAGGYKGILGRTFIESEKRSLYTLDRIADAIKKPVSTW